MSRERCPKCGLFVLSEDRFVASMAMKAVKWTAYGGCLVGKALGKLPTPPSRIMGSIVGYALESVVNSIPTNVLKFKCLCGNSWIRIK